MAGDEVQSTHTDHVPGWRAEGDTAKLSTVVAMSTTVCHQDTATTALLVVAPDVHVVPRSRRRLRSVAVTGVMSMFHPVSVTSTGDADAPAIAVGENDLTAAENGGSGREKEGRGEEKEQRIVRKEKKGRVEGDSVDSRARGVFRAKQYTED